MADGYLPNAELLRLLKTAAKQHKTSFQPRPVSGRRAHHPPRPGSQGSQPGLIRGKVFADVAAGDASFEIDHIIPLASGSDPRSDPSSDTERITIASNLKEALTAGEDVTAVYSAAVIPETETDVAVDWELIVVERYRALRGTWYSGSSTLQVKAIIPLESGLDPRTDTTDDDEVISVVNVATDSYTTGDKVYADWNAKDGVWEARPKGSGSGSSTLVWGTITVTGSGATVPGTPTTDGEVTLFAAFGGDVLTGVKNYFPDEAPYGRTACVDRGESDAKFVTWSCKPA